MGSGEAPCDIAEPPRVRSRSTPGSPFDRWRMFNLRHTSSSLGLIVALATPLCVGIPSHAYPALTTVGDGATGVDDKSGGVINLTGTAQGDDALEQAFKNTDLPPSATYEVLTNVPGDFDRAIWVVPDGAQVPTVTAEPDGSYQALLSETPSAELTAPERATSSSKDANARSLSDGVEDPINDPDCPPNLSCKPEKKLVWEGTNCFARYDEKIAWLDRCSTWGKIKFDGDASSDHWAFKQFATCKSAPQTVLKSCTLRQIKGDETATRYWDDWAPKSDKPSSACSALSIGLSYFGVSIGGSFNACEEVDITKYEEGARFSAAWKDGGAVNVVNSEREIAYRVAWRQTQGSNPTLKTSWDVHAYVLQG